MAQQIVANLTRFARMLRKTGLPVGTDRVIQASAALVALGLSNREEVRAALAACLLSSHDQRPGFDLVFDAFWRDPRLLEQMMLRTQLAATTPVVSAEPSANPNRIAAAFDLGGRFGLSSAAADDGSNSHAARTGHSALERLGRADFESMSADEYRGALRLVASIELPVRPVPCRRRMPSGRGEIDLRQTMRRMARTPDTLVPSRSRPGRRVPAVVILLDISASMERYARMFLHYAHGLTRRDPRTQTLCFGTRLTSLTRALKQRDPDVAMAMAANQIRDWRGGTRLAESLGEFNRRWARRVLCGNAALLLVSDGLDRGETDTLRDEAQRASRFAHEFIWLNPLLRYAGFEPRAAGIRAILPHVDRFLPMHNLDSLRALGRELAHRRHNVSSEPTRSNRHDGNQL